MKELHEYWRVAGNPGVPGIVAHCYVALGPQAVIDEALRTVVDYYQYTSDAARFPSMWHRRQKSFAVLFVRTKISVRTK